MRISRSSEQQQNIFFDSQAGPSDPPSQQMIAPRSGIFHRPAWGPRRCGSPEYIIPTAGPLEDAAPTNLGRASPLPSAIVRCPILPNDRRTLAAPARIPVFSIIDHLELRMPPLEHALPARCWQARVLRPLTANCLPSSPPRDVVARPSPPDAVIGLGLLAKSRSQ